MTNFTHKTVMLHEATEHLNCRPGKLYIDATAGGGGHSYEIAKRIQPDGQLLALDVDPDALTATGKKLEEFKNTAKVIKSSYTEIPEVLEELNIEKITGGVLFDLGASYHQLISEEKGFSFTKDSKLDMRFNPDNPVSAYDIVNNYSEEELKRIFKEYGEERFSGRIARRIAELRKVKEIKTTFELAEIVKKATPYKKSRIHPATRVFQGLRIAVNDEMGAIEKTLNNIIHLLAKDARIVVITFHSLEDRLVKNIFKRYSAKCLCPKEQMICKCEEPLLRLITRKPLLPSKDEVKDNPPSRSAKLRVAEKAR